MKKRGTTQERSKRGGAVSETQEKPESVNEHSIQNPEEAVKPFRDASIKFLQAAMEARQNAAKDSTRAHLDFQKTVQEAEKEAYDAVVEATRKQMSRLNEQPSSSAEETYRIRIEAQINYEKEVRQAYANAQQRVQETTLKLFGAEGGGDFVKRLTSQRQEAYRQYLVDLQQAWSGMKDLNQQTIKTIATNILYTLNVF